MRRGLAESRSEAQAAIDAGLVTVDGAPARKAASQVRPDEAVTVHAPPRRYVSRGGDKLAWALTAFGIDPTGRRCLDAGMSTGGFTDCLLQHGAAHVIGYDVGYGQVHNRLRSDDRVTVVERTNIRDVGPGDVPPPAPDLLVCDVSFIALTIVLPVLRALGTQDADAVVLVKPQFEADREQVGKNGVVRDPAVWTDVLHRVAETAATVGWRRFDVVPSPLLGPAGNVEFLAHLRTGVPTTQEQVVARIEDAVAAGRRLRETGELDRPKVHGEQS